MKRVLFAFLLLPVFSLSASARQKAVEYRHGDAFRGPVRSARIEHATYSRLDGRLVEGPRRLVSVSTYTPDGKRSEQEAYAPDGTLRKRYVHVYDDAGHGVEMSVFDGAGNLETKRVFRPAGETLVYNGDGSLRERWVVFKRPDGSLAETHLYDGGGALVQRSVNERDAKTSVWSTYRADGSLKKQDVHTLSRRGPYRAESKTYAPDGSVARRRVSDMSDVDAGVRDLSATEEGSDGAAPIKTREKREYDSRGNPSKITAFRWNAGAGEYEPASVSYYTIEYYR